MTSHVRISSERRLAGGADDAREVSSLDEYGDQQQNIPLDFVSGGGFIEQSSRAKANFGVDGGVKHGAFWGHPNYIDHGIGLHVKAQHPAYVFINERARDTCGRAQTNLVGEVAFDLRPTDNGDPGRDDIFINLRQNGVIVYTAEGDPGRALGGPGPGAATFSCTRGASRTRRGPLVPFVRSSAHRSLIHRTSPGQRSIPGDTRV